MITADEIRTTIQGACPDAHVDLHDMTGGQDHWEGIVVSDLFEGISRVQRHRMVHTPLAEALVERLHAFTFKTYTYTQAREAGLLTAGQE
jgi:stress-induced morphogen